MDFNYIVEITPVLMEGAKLTVFLFAITLLLALPLGLPIALGENSKIAPIRWVCKFYVLILRGTPLMLQLFFFYFFFPLQFGLQLPAFETAALTFVLNYAAYFAEIYRGGINGIDRGQYEAAYSLGLSRNQTTFGIIVPQMMRVVLPSISNEAIVLIKDTAMASAIGLAEIMRNSKGIVNRDGELVAYVIAALIYLVMTLLLTMVLNKVEAHYSRYSKREA